MLHLPVKSKIIVLSKELIIEIRGLSKSIGGYPVLADFGMEVYSGDICGVVGPNDSGKTMLFRILTTLVNPDKGKIRIFGKKLVQGRRDLLKNMGVLIDEPVFYDHLNAFDNLSVFSRYFGLSRDNDEINRVLKLTGLTELSETKVRYFASGDRKKLAIAMAIFNNPPLVLLDEPFRALDVKSLAEIKNLIKRINKEFGTTFLIASKRLDDLEGFISRVILIEGGQLIAEGNVDELMRKSTISLILETDDNEKALKLLRACNFKLGNVVEDDYVLRISCTRDIIPLINLLMTESGIAVKTLCPDNAISSYYLTFTE